MNANLSSKASIDIQADLDKIWDVLTNPEKIKLYLNGTNTVTSWAPGSPLSMKGEYEGRTYEDKGEILENEYGQVLSFTYFNSMEGYADKPENYSVFTYRIEPIAEREFRLTVSRDKIPTKEEQGNLEKYMPAVMDQIKRLAEQGA